MKARSLMTRMISVILVLAMVVSASPVAFASEIFGSSAQKLAFEKVEGVEADVRLDASKVEPAEEEPEYADTDIVRVSIVLESQPTLERYSTNQVAENAKAMAYRQGLQREQSVVTNQIEKQVLKGESLDVVWNLTLAGNIISANVPYGRIEAIESVDGVAEVIIENQYDPMVVSTAAGDPMMATSSEMIGSANAWASGYTGAGTRIAIIDTGIDTDHQSFDADAYLHSLEQQAADKGMDADAYIESLDLLDSAEIADVLTDLNIYSFVEYEAGTAAGAYYVNEKIPFALNYVDRDYEVTHDDGISEHGSHVAGIAAANSYIPNAEGSYDNALEAVATQGVAPDAQIIVMKVFGKTGGAYESDYMVAIEDAIMLGCDVVNLSLGTDKGFSRSSQYQQIMDNLVKSDTIVAIAAGNAGHWAEYAASGVSYLYAEDVDLSMVASPSAATNALAVASVDNIGATNYYISVDDQIIFYDPGIFSDGSYANALTTLAGDVNYIFTDSIGSAEDVAAIVANEGTIAENTLLVCARGTINFGVKANNAVANGFVGSIIYNNATGVLNMNLDGYEYPNPSVSITMADSAKLKEAAEAVTDSQGNVLYYKGTMTVSDRVGTSVVSDTYTMSSFSSWGVPSSLEMKPEITAPGGNIYSVDGSDPSGTAYENMSGTSMATPQIAGMSALVMQYIQENDLDEATDLSPRQLATALLMATAEPLFDGDSYYPVMQQGAGLANVGSALEANSYIVMADSATSGAADGKVKVELGDDPNRDGTYSFSFTLNNFSEETEVYALSSDFFTQGTFTSDGISYLDTATTTLSMGVDYAIDDAYISASSSYDCDLNGDGVTDEQDAQIILEYAAGTVETIADSADLDDDGSVKTYDAHLLLASIRSDYFMVAPGESVSVTVSMSLSDAVKAYLDETYVNGAYLEGYVYVTSPATAEGELEPDYSIPVLGFYGDWSDASMYDHLNYEEYLYASTNGTDFVYPYSGGMNYLTFYDSHHNESYYVGNPYIVEDTFPAEKVAISPDMELGDMAVSLIRNAGGFMFYVADGEGNVVRSTAVDQIRSAYYYANGGYWAYVNSAGLSIWETPGSLGGFEHGDVFTVGFMAVPEYYEQDGALTADDMLDMMESGEIGEGAYHTYTFTVDGQAPEILSVSKDENGDLIVSAKDDRHVAAMAVLSASGGSVLTMTGVEQDELGSVVETVIDMEGVSVNRNCLVMVADYAGNETYYQVAYNDGLDDFDGRMYAFTNVATRGTANTWMEIDPENIFYASNDDNENTMGGTTEMAVMDCTVTAAEYVNGYVFMITENDQLVVGPQGEWDQYSLARTDKNYAKIRDLAYDTVNGILYALGTNNTIYTIDLVTGEMEKQYTVTIAAPEGADADGFTKTFTAENFKLLTLAINDEGDFYSVNSGDTNYKRVYLYSWSADDIGEDGNVSGLTPVNNTYDGFAGDYVYSDSEDYMGNPCTQSMAWDHDKDILYWANALAPVSAYNTLYVFDTATGKVSLASDDVAGVADYQMSVLCGNVSGMYIVPSESGDMPVSTEAASVGLHTEDVTLIENAQYHLDWDVLPWNLTDKSVTFASSDETVATVTGEGVITAVGVGTATITVTTNAAPNVTDTCTVTVEELQNVTLNAMLYDEAGSVQWVEFDLEDPASWQSLYTEDTYYFQGGGQLGDVVYVHDGNHMYGVNADTFEVTDYGYLDPTWTWSDAAPGPKTPDGYFDRIVGILNGGKSIGVMDVTEGSGYEITHYSDMRGETMAVIAYVGPATYHDGYSLNNGHEYYILTESGKLYSSIVYAFYDTDAMVVHYNDAMTYVGDTGLRLNGVSNVGGSRTASMYYDEVNDYLIVTSYQSGSETRVYAFDPDYCAPVEVGTFGADVWPVTSLYRYTTITELTVKVKPETTEVYAGETVALSASVYPADTDQAVTWSSSDEAVATVDENGVVTTHAAGTVTITATSVAANENGEQASGTAVITVNALKTVDETFHAYIQTAEGGKWVCIDGNDLSFKTLSESDAVYTGAAVSEGKVYATDDTYYYQIDPKGGYTVTQGDNFTNGDGAAFMYMLDGTGAPVVSGEFEDLVTGEMVTADMGGYPVYISGFDGSGYYYITTLNDYTTGEFGATSIDYTYNPAAIAYQYSEEIEGYWFDFYLFLGYDGLLDMYTLYSSVADGEVVTAGGWENYSVNTGLEFEDGDDVSMVYVENDSFTGVVISHATENGTDFYSYDMDNNTVGKMGAIAEATDLVGLSLLSDVGVEEPEEPVDPEEPEVPEQPANDGLYGYVSGEDGYMWVKINPADLSYEAVSESSSVSYNAAGESNGLIYAVTGVSKYGNTTYTYQQIDPANGYAATAGTSAPGWGYHPVDFTGAPAATVELEDSMTGEMVSVNVGGYALHVSNGNYSSSAPKVYQLLDYSGNAGEYYVEPYVSSSTFSGKLAAIAYIGGELSPDNTEYYEKFLILGQDGSLYNYQLTNLVEDGVASIYGQAYVTSAGTIDLAPTAGASMTLTGENVVTISVNGDDGVALYSYNVAEAALTELGTMADFGSLVGLYAVSGASNDTEEPEQPVVPDVPTDDTLMLHGYIAAEEGNVWVSINGEDLSYETLSDYSTVNYNAAGANEGVIYAVTGVSKYGNTTYTYQSVDPANGYAATAGVSAPGWGYHPVDFTGAPSATVELEDGATGEMVSVDAGGYFMHISNGNYSSSVPKVYLIDDYAGTAEEYYQEPYVSSGTFSGKLAAIAYTGSELSPDNTEYYEYFLILGQDGSLYEYYLTTYVEEGVPTIYGQAYVTSLGTIDLAPASGASMTLMGEDTVAISVNADDGVQLYSYSLADGTLTQMGTIEDAVSLVGLSLLSDVQTADAAALTAARGRSADGSLMAVTVGSESGEELETSGVTIADGQVTVNLTETEDVTNGKLVVTYDPEALTFTGVSSGSVFYAVNANEAGKVVVAYASAEAVSAGEILATLNFTYEGKYVDTVVSIETQERNEDSAVSEDATEVVISKEPAVIASGWSGYTTWKFTEDGVLTISPSGQTYNGKVNMRNYWKVDGVLTLPWGEYADQITSVVVEEGVNAIGQMAFYGLENLKSVTLASTVEEVRNYAFKNCTALTSVNGSDSLMFIREGAFYGCSALNGFEFADGCTVEDWAFSRTSVIVP